MHGAVPLVVGLLLVTGCGSGAAASSPVDSSPRVSATEATPTTAPARAPHRLVTRAHWRRDAPGHQLVVTPTRYGRRHAVDQLAATLDAALAAGRPTPLTLTRTIRASLRNQLHCHAEFVPGKPTWDLESFRPDVGYPATVAALCNPS